MQRRTDLWGPDANEFDLDRWLDDRNKKYYPANPFIFLPFHGGPRICIGQQVIPLLDPGSPRLTIHAIQFALNEASFFIIRLLQSFDSITLAPDAFPPKTLPPPEWKQCKNGRKAVEKVYPISHLTAYFKVRSTHLAPDPN